MMQSYTSLSELRKDLFAGKFGMDAVVRHYLEKIESGRHLNIFLEVFGDEALAHAAAIQQKISEGRAGKLAGMVIALKDNIVYRGHRASGSSRILEGFTSLFSATVVTRLLEEDAIIIGRTNCDEFAMGSSNENSAYGPVRNPLDPTTVPGGSSGGSAAAVAAGMCLAALGSDTGGSIRQPASLTGLVGVKPTYGRVSRHGLMAFASSFDQIGTFTHNVGDAAILLEVIAGPDAYDGTAADRPVPEYSQKLPLDGPLTIGYVKQCLESPGLNEEIRTRVREVLAQLTASGHTVREVELPLLDYLVPTYYVLTTAEASSNLARYDGIHFGYRASGVAGIDATYTRSRTEGFGSEVKRRIMLGTFVLSAGYYDAYYVRAQRVRRLIAEETRNMLRSCNFILTPTTTSTAFKLGAKSNDPIAMYLEDIFTVQAPLAGIPGISLPLGLTQAGMPFGIQLMSDLFTEHALLSFSDWMMEHCAPVPH